MTKGPSLQGQVDHSGSGDLLYDIIPSDVVCARVLALSPLGLDCFQADTPEWVARGAAHECIGDVVLR